ncbi:MAG TPA: 4-(cytidine 5'-diphospho)-2-C-methyl-D-erythritol kinase [Thermoanaerobaculia bacterium]|jgi:4-diphosphocytidyl-2-C-methyl-D-erythritol kinase|nr:4-(cytidine 5'-diphospho)-2-C-methyl-D-erythritol kinase [Thermoanaerobaculia bacterium]
MLRAQAPAKVNRELRVGPRRPDGFHEVLSRIVSIDLADSIEIEAAEGLTLEVTGAAIPADATNLVHRAAVLLAERLGVPPRARIRLQKNVPTGAGLGGGSADAAVTLQLLAQLWKAGLAESELSELAARLGSDVPFFLRGGEAQMSGRGETVAPSEDNAPRALLLLVPPFPLSTAEVYASYDREYGPSGVPLPKRLEVETSGRFFGPNDLALPVLRKYPEMNAYLRSAEEIAPDHAMSGSGSVVAIAGFGPGAAQELARRHPEARILSCRTLRQQEYARLVHPSGGSSWT